MTQGYINQIALDTISEQQSKTKANADKDNLLYLMGFNDGVIELALNLRDKTQAESEPQESESKRYMELAKSYSQGLRAGLAESEDKE